MAVFTVADWDSMERVIIETRGWAFQTLGQAFDFLFSLQKLDWVFQKVIWMFQILNRVFWNKCSAESFNQWTHQEFLEI